MSLGNKTSLHDLLRGMPHVADLDDNQLDELAQSADFCHARPGTQLLAIGSNDTRLLFLLQGTLELLAADGAVRVVRDTDLAAQDPISRLRPSRYQVTALTDVGYLLLERQALERLAKPCAASSMLIEEIGVIETSPVPDNVDTDHPVLFDVFIDLHRDRIVVPSDPEVAIQIGRALQQLVDDPRRLASTLAICPALSLKVLRAAMATGREANSIRSTRMAVQRLGTEQTLGLTVNCVLRESLRSSSPVVRDRLRDWWQRTMRVAAISRSLARVSERFDPEYATLIGLLHSIAEPVLLGYADQHEDLAQARTLDDVLHASRQDLGRILLTYWGMPHEIVEAAHLCNDWKRDHPGEADYTDILLVAQWHAVAGDERHRQPPPSDEISAFDRLGVRKASPKLSQHIAEATLEIARRADELLSR
ncbi:MAG: HDOD domain-containing protein [Sedimenticolaceae bacterium]